MTLVGIIRADTQGTLHFYDSSADIELAPELDLDVSHLERLWMVTQFYIFWDVWNKKDGKGRWCLRFFMRECISLSPNPKYTENPTNSIVAFIMTKFRSSLTTFRINALQFSTTDTQGKEIPVEFENTSMWNVLHVGQCYCIENIQIQGTFLIFRITSYVHCKETCTALMGEQV